MFVFFLGFENILFARKRFIYSRKLNVGDGSFTVIQWIHLVTRAVQPKISQNFHFSKLLLLNQSLKNLLIIFFYKYQNIMLFGVCLYRVLFLKARALCWKHFVALYQTRDVNLFFLESISYGIAHQFHYLVCQNPHHPNPGRNTEEKLFGLVKKIYPIWMILGTSGVIWGNSFHFVGVSVPVFVFLLCFFPCLCVFVLYLSSFCVSVDVSRCVA